MWMNLLKLAFLGLLVSACDSHTATNSQLDGRKGDSSDRSAIRNAPTVTNSALDGVWQGTIGEERVRVCFDTKLNFNGDHYKIGAYFYLKNLALKPLYHRSTESLGEWHEVRQSDGDIKGPVWRTIKVNGSQLTGSWSGEGKAAPIALARITIPQNDMDFGLCGSLTFNKPRAPMPRIVTQRAVIDGTAYSELKADVGSHLDVTIASFRLDGNTPALRRINAALSAEFLREVSNKAEDSHYFECMTVSLGANGAEAPYISVTVPALITRQWMVTESTDDGYCGGTHGYSYINWTTWDLTTGEPVNLSTWFNPSSASVKNYGIMPNERLRRMLVEAQPKTDSECRLSTLEGRWSWEVHLTKTGMAFFQPPPNTSGYGGCEANLTFRQIDPLLNAAGKAAVRSFQSDLARR